LELKRLRTTSSYSIFSRTLNSPANRHDKLFTLSGPVDSGKGPSDTDAKEDVDGVGASDVTD